MNADFYIEKLKDMVRDNPDSKLFLTLAEELRKRGEGEEGMAVLMRGISSNPNFVSARLTLGRWHLRDGKLAEAKREFTIVLTLAPDDKFAARYLREIEGQAGKEQGKIVIEKLNTFLDGIKKTFASGSTDTAAADRR
jgi:tetratricopeptide (TPR) repeat protein